MYAPAFEGNKRQRLSGGEALGVPTDSGMKARKGDAGLCGVAAMSLTVYKTSP